MYQRILMYVPFEGDYLKNIKPIIYDRPEDIGDNWIMYRIEGTDKPFYITHECIEDFIIKGYITILDQA